MERTWYQSGKSELDRKRGVGNLNIVKIEEIEIKYDTN